MLNGNKLTLYVIQVPTPTCISDASADGMECLVPVCISSEEMGKTGEYSTKFRDKLNPRIS